MDTLLLDLTTWDLVVDSFGNIALASEPYSQAQDVASACKTFLGECWYDNTVGIPYWQNILGQLPPLGILEQYLINAALTVPGVTSAQCTIQTFTDRAISGQVTFTNTGGVTQSVSI